MRDPPPWPPAEAPLYAAAQQDGVAPAGRHALHHDVPERRDALGEADVEVRVEGAGGPELGHGRAGLHVGQGARARVEAQPAAVAVAPREELAVVEK